MIFGMLGDIHSRQPMILDGNGKVKVAYAGSLIQQNFGEESREGFSSLGFRSKEMYVYRGCQRIGVLKPLD